MRDTLYPRLIKYTDRFADRFAEIPEDRKKDLKKVADFISAKVIKRLPARIIFICTHNSRRSHMGQIWATTAAFFYGIPGVETYSGGTKATAFNPNAVIAMQQAGFRITSDGKSVNPEYSVSFKDGYPAMKVFSKKYDNRINPVDDFCAVMTCSEADANCPFIPGAALRVPVTYEDPKEFDGSENESTAYKERCFQIGVEMFYLFDQVKTE